jgi:hypothetical protein
MLKAALRTPSSAGHVQRWAPRRILDLGMKRREEDYRRRVATLAHSLRSGELEFFDFLKEIGGNGNPYDTGDDEIDQLVDLFEHEPSVGRLFGVNPVQYAAYLLQIDTIISRLEDPKDES